MEDQLSLLLTFGLVTACALWILPVSKVSAATSGTSWVCKQELKTKSILLDKNKKWTTIGPISGPITSLLHANYITPAFESEAVYKIQLIVISSCQLMASMVFV